MVPKYLTLTLPELTRQKTQVDQINSNTPPRQFLFVNLCNMPTYSITYAQIVTSRLFPILYLCYVFAMLLEWSKVKEKKDEKLSKARDPHVLYFKSSTVALNVSRYHQ